MKIILPHKTRSTTPRSRRREDGLAVIVVMALIAILLLYVVGNIRTLASLGRELKLLDQQQKQRLQIPGKQTNSVARVVSYGAGPFEMTKTNLP